MSQAPHDLRATAVDAIATVVARAGLAPTSSEVVAEGGSVVVRLDGTGLVARASTHTAAVRADPAAWYAREVAVARALAHEGADVVAPARVVDPGPYAVGRVVVSLWEDAGDDPQRPTPAETGLALARLHEASERLPDDVAATLPVLAPVLDQTASCLDVLARAGTLDDTDMTMLRDEHTDVVALMADAVTDQPLVVVHGDAHPGNLVRSADRWLWLDLEEVCRAPVLWDLATLRRSRATDGRAALAAYARARGMPEPSDAELAPMLRARQLLVAAWACAASVSGPALFSAQAEAALSELRAQPASP